MKFLLIALICAAPLSAQLKSIPNIHYAQGEGTSLGLDLYLPPKQTGPVIVYVHGGAWRSGSKSEMPLNALVEWGCPVASVDYRLSTVARFPAQVHDIKAAIRFLRAKGKTYGIDATKVVIAGSSAGGHLAALVGVSNGVKDLEGELGEFRNEKSDVQGIVSFYGGSDLTTILSQSTPKGLEMRMPALDLLLGAQPDKVEDLAKLASPVFHVDKTDPPLLLFHGDRDPQMPINQSHQLEGAYEKAGLKVRFKVLHGAGHGGKVFYEPEQLATVKDFLGALHFFDDRTRPAFVNPN